MSESLNLCSQEAHKLRAVGISKSDTKSVTAEDDTFSGIVLEICSTPGMA